MAPPSRLRVIAKKLVENWLTPALCAAGMALYNVAALKWPALITFAQGIGIDALFVNGIILSGMTLLANLISRGWKKPVFDPAMTTAEAVAELKAEDKAALTK